MGFAIDIYNYQELVDALNESRNKFYENSKDCSEIFEEVVNLYIDSKKLIAPVLEQGDDEVYGLKVLDISFRRIISLFILIESGMDDEANMILRNAIDYILIAIDILYNKESLEEWKKTDYDNLSEKGDWFFTPKKITERIKKDVNNKIYPKWESSIALFDLNGKKQFISIWEYISNRYLHAHSIAQAKYQSDNKFYLFFLKEAGDYKNDFYKLRNYTMVLISIMIFIPKYQTGIIGRKEFGQDSIAIVNRFNNIQNRMEQENELVK